MIGSDIIDILEGTTRVNNTQQGGETARVGLHGLRNLMATANTLLGQDQDIHNLSISTSIYLHTFQRRRVESDDVSMCPSFGEVRAVV
jgi:hypothetical protein